MIATHPPKELDSFGIRPPHYQLPEATRIGTATLAVADLRESVEFYENVIGLSILKQQEFRAQLGVGSKILLELQQVPGIHALGRRTRLGLFHVAFLLPSRGALGSFVQHLDQLGIQYGAGDHLYSEALYLVDPNGFTVEVYADRARSTWQTRGHELLTATEPVDLSSLQGVSEGEWKGAPEATTIGHVHFYVGDLEQASRFYHEALGFTAMTWSFPGALFVAAGGYHHHVGLNTWAGGAPPASEADARLLSWELLVSESEIEKLRNSLLAVGWPVELDSNGRLTATDPWGITVQVTTPEQSRTGVRLEG